VLQTAESVAIAIEICYLRQAVASQPSEAAVVNGRQLVLNTARWLIRVMTMEW